MKTFSLDLNYQILFKYLPTLFLAPMTRAIKQQVQKLENDKKHHSGLNYKVSKQKKFKLFPGQLRLS